MKIEGEVSVNKIMRNLKHGFSNMPHLKWVSVAGVRISVAGFLGLAGFILALRDGRIRNWRRLVRFSERTDSTEYLCLVPGLRNLGNICFLNVILQAFASCSCFQLHLQKIMEECESSAVDGGLESMPLTVALAALLKELCTVSDQRIVLSPVKVMRAMVVYIPNFNLTRQQDAAEAFLHILSLLREEFSDCFPPNLSSLADVSTLPDFRILTPKRMEYQIEQERWHKHFLGPFDGILGSILTCQSCSSQISLDYEFFHSIPLSPVLSSGATIMGGCTLEDCVKQFIAAEQVENYRCIHCWHINGMKYLCSIGANETDIGKLRSCSKQDSCDCRSLFGLEALPWSNNFSLTFKQLSIARCPKILCIHVKRASVNEFGEVIKLQGHISFPLILDMCPFMKSGVGITKWEENMQRGQAKLQNQRPLPHPYHFNMQFETTMFNSIYGQIGTNILSEAVSADEFGCSPRTQAFQGESSLPQTESCSNAMNANMCMQSDSKVSVPCHSIPLETRMYRLVSVVEHFGRDGSGHYTVYRIARATVLREDSDGQFELPCERWFCISDSAVYSASEEDVLASEASLLFYERIEEGG